jgi:hypothetical protein
MPESTMPPGTLLVVFKVYLFSLWFAGEPNWVEEAPDKIKSFGNWDKLCLLNDYYPPEMSNPP